MLRPPVALITGASRGIGLEIAKALATTHHLLISARDPERLATAADELRDFQSRATQANAAGNPNTEGTSGDASTTATGVTACAADLGDPAQRQRLIEFAIGQLATRSSRLEVLVNNAGVATSAPLHRTVDEVWRSTIEVDLVAPFELMRAFLPIMAQQSHGRVINVASTAALKGYRNMAAYSAAKGGLVAMTRSLAAEFAGRNITVNAVCPGFVATDLVTDAAAAIAARTGKPAEGILDGYAKFNPQGRIVTSEEVASLVAWLATSTGSAMVSGQAFAIDGGETG